MPKRINNVFKEAITFSKLLEAHNKCKKNKRYKKQVIEFEMNLERNIISLGTDLISGRYEFSKYFEFTIYEPKERKIKTLNYKDRVILCWYVENFLKPYFKPNFIEDSYACLEGKGTHKAIDIHKLIHSTNANEITKLITKFNLSETQINKLNKYRKKLKIELV